MCEPGHTSEVNEPAVLRAPSSYCLARMQGVNVKMRIAVTAVILGGIGALGAAPVAQAHTPLTSYVERLDYQGGRAVERAPGEAGDAADIMGGDAGFVAGETVALLNRAINPR